MKRGLLILLFGLGGLAIYFAFFQIPFCVSAATHRIHLPSSVGACPPFVDASLTELQHQFTQRVASGSPSDQIESALYELGVEFSWNKYSSTYQGILRHPESSFHAIRIRVFVDAVQRFERIEIEDSFTAP